MYNAAVHTHAHSSLPIVRLDVQVVSLVGTLDKPNASDVMKGQQPTLDDGVLTRS